MEKGRRGVGRGDEGVTVALFRRWKGAMNFRHFPSLFSRSSCLCVLFLSFLATLYVLVCFECNIDTVHHE